MKKQTAQNIVVTFWGAGLLVGMALESMPEADGLLNIVVAGLVVSFPFVLYFLFLNNGKNV